MKRLGLSAKIMGFCKMWFATLWAARRPFTSNTARNFQTTKAMSLSQQWAMIAGLLSEAGRAADEARQLHKIATQQLDLAQYGLITMREELAAVMAISSRRDKTAAVHLFEPASGMLQPHALAA